MSTTIFDALSIFSPSQKQSHRIFYSNHWKKHANWRRNVQQYIRNINAKKNFYQEIHEELCDDQELFFNVNQVCFETMCIQNFDIYVLDAAIIIVLHAFTASSTLLRAVL